MKSIFMLILLNLALLSYGLTAATNTNTLATYIKFWGILKYHHPAVTSGKMDWDKVFLEHYDSVSKVEMHSELNPIFSEILNSCDAIKKAKHKKQKSKQDCIALNKPNFHFKNIDDELHEKILHLINTPKKSQHYLVAPFTDGIMTMVNEKEPGNSSYLSKPEQLLGIARYWNFMDQFYPYKSRLEISWDKLLEEYIDKMLQSEHPIEYYKLMREFTAQIRDTHFSFRSAISDSIFNAYFGDHHAPFFTGIVENKVVITWIDPNDATVQKLKVGDIVLKIDGEDMNEVIARYKQYIITANKSAQNRDLNYNLFRGTTASVDLLIERLDEQYNISVNRYKESFERRRYSNALLSDNRLYKVNDTTLYIQPYQLSEDRIKQAMEDKSLHKVIIDLRIYNDLRTHQNSYVTLLNMLSHDKAIFAKIYQPLWSKPGCFFEKEHHLEKPLKYENKNIKKVMIVDDHTQSHLEFKCMMFQSLSNAIVVGTQTAGALADAIRVPLPGEIHVIFTRAIATYPDGKYIYPSGVKIDHEVNRTISGIRAGKDELLIEAVGR